jgi:hypothetical protein
MPKSDAKPDKNTDPEEYKRFLEVAKKLEADTSPKAFDRAFKKVTGATPRNRSPRTRDGGSSQP